MKITNLEKLLPFGYLILVILGIIKESVLYYQLGINILNYSSLTDILLSPIASLTTHPIILFSLCSFMGLAYFGYTFFSKHPEHKLAKTFLDFKTLHPMPSQEELQRIAGKKFVGFFVIANMSFFLGIGIGNGKMLSNKIKNNTLSFDKTITLMNGDSKSIALIGSNSLHYFYIEKDKKTISIAPITAILSLQYNK